MSPRLFAVALVLLAPATWAQSQSTDATLVTTPVIPRDVERQREIERATDAREYRAAYDAAYASYGGQRLSERDIKRARCNDAKSHREATLREVGLSRDFEMLRALDDAVYEACRGL
ncbi:hypothetical protein LK996_02185 [Lysobacter sp. A6]|uniref:UrcA family protein n=1 Tax=Noviluteimonas lactosilytica TaxID=2888523 RepID=A0ABS8JE53_9GAMM|nr:hypothetical protein [Lysobacter lactosilyticus]MCC8361893.1 hypothetical protein [Lysobacter lactosilyticus]